MAEKPTKQTTLTELFDKFIKTVDPDPMREGVAETPARVAKAWGTIAGGYEKDPLELLKTFEDGAQGYDEMILVKDYPFWSTCEHHLLPIFGRATIAYIPKDRVLGLSKLPRVLEVFARRLQTQERLTAQVADCLFDNLRPRGVGVLIRARHACMEARGVCQHGHTTTTSALRGVMYSGEPRAEFLALGKSDVPI